MQKAVQDTLDKLTENCNKFREHIRYKKQQQG